MGRSRTSNSIRNASWTTIAQFVSIAILFINRTIFIYCLGNEYLSVNGLFSNILSLLSFAELGIGSAIVYSLYKPISENDNGKIAAIMELYNKAYKWIAIAIAILGICVIPFLKFIINEPTNIDENLGLIYFLFLANSVASYIFSYKKAIITADQRDYIVTVYQQYIYIIQAIIQTLVLLIFDSFILYLVIAIVCTLINNILIFKKANKLYPFLKNNKNLSLSNKDRNTIFVNIKAIVFYKFGSVILTGTDNIIISAIINLSSVGLISNYTLIINSINSIVSKAFESIAASVGNLNASSETEEKYKIFNQLFLIVFWIFGFCSICLVILLNPFIELWIGSEFLCSKIVSISLVSTFYVLGLNSVASLYRTTLGYFVQAKYTPVLAVIVNIVLSLSLGKAIGLQGIFFATAIARLSTFGIIDPVLVYTKAFHLSPFIYYKKYIIHLMVLLFTYYVVENFIELVHMRGFGGFIVKLIICIIITNLIFTICFLRTKAFNEIKLRAYNLIRSKMLRT